MPNMVTFGLEFKKLLSHLKSAPSNLKACNVIKKRLYHRYFPVNFTKFLRTASFTEHLQWLLMECVEAVLISLRYNLHKL